MEWFDIKKAVEKEGIILKEGEVLERIDYDSDRFINLRLAMDFAKDKIKKNNKGEIMAQGYCAGLFHMGEKPFWMMFVPIEK